MEPTLEEPRLCVYTALIGRYERLNEQPVAARSSIPFICLTDDPQLSSQSWGLRQVTPLFPMDPIRSQRDLKLRPHAHLADFGASLYIDNSVLLTEPPERLFERCFPASGMALPTHSFRDTVLDEFLEVARLGFDDQSRVFEQLNHYAISDPESLAQRPYWTGLLLRDHRNAALRALLDRWMAHVNRYSRRDQLSIVAALRQCGFVPDALDLDNHASWAHTWPHAQDRVRDAGPRLPATSFSPPIARIRELERSLTEGLGREQALAEQLRRTERALAETSRRALPSADQLKKGSAAALRIWANALRDMRNLLRKTPRQD